MKYCSLEIGCRYASDSESGEQTVLESMKDYLINTIQRTFEIGPEKAECLYGELLQCTRKKNLVSTLDGSILVLQSLTNRAFFLCVCR